MDIIVNFLAYGDGKTDLLDISETIGVPAERYVPPVRRLAGNGLLEPVG